MAKLSDFAGKKLSKEQASPQQNTQSQPNPSAAKAEEIDLMKQYNQLKDLSGDELSSKLAEEVARQKQAGSFDYAGVQSMLENLQGMVPPENYTAMKRMLDALK